MSIFNILNDKLLDQDTLFNGIAGGIPVKITSKLSKKLVDLRLNNLSGSLDSSESLQKALLCEITGDYKTRVKEVYNFIANIVKECTTIIKQEPFFSCIPELEIILEEGAGESLIKSIPEKYLNKNQKTIIRKVEKDWTTSDIAYVTPKEIDQNKFRIHIFFDRLYYLSTGTIIEYEVALDLLIFHYKEPKILIETDIPYDVRSMIQCNIPIDQILKFTEYKLQEKRAKENDSYKTIMLNVMRHEATHIVEQIQGKIHRNFLAKNDRIHKHAKSMHNILTAANTLNQHATLSAYEIFRITLEIFKDEIMSEGIATFIGKFGQVPMTEMESKSAFAYAKRDAEKVEKEWLETMIVFKDVTFVDLQKVQNKNKDLSEKLYNYCYSIGYHIYFEIARANKYTFNELLDMDFPALLKAYEKSTNGPKIICLRGDAIIKLNDMSSYLNQLRKIKLKE
jgi:hypothetical protein